jgi:hypothetical protein
MKKGLLTETEQDRDFWFDVANYFLERAPNRLCADALIAACENSDIDAECLAQEILNGLPTEKDKQITDEIRLEWGDH